MSKLPASSIGSTTEEVVAAPAVEPVEAVTPVEERESGGRRLRRLARRLRPGPAGPVFLLVFLALAVWMFAPGVVVADHHHPRGRGRRPGDLHVVPALGAVRPRARARPAGHPPPQLPGRREPDVEHVAAAARAAAGPGDRHLGTGAELQPPAGAGLRALGLVRLPGHPALRPRAPGGGGGRAGLRLLPGDPGPVAPPAHVAGLPGPADTAGPARDPGPPAALAVAGRHRPRPDGRRPAPDRRGAAGHDGPARLRHAPAGGADQPAPRAGAMGCTPSRRSRWPW